MTDIERPPSADRTVRLRVMVLLAGGVAALLTLVAARFSRPGVGPDAVAYLAVANSPAAREDGNRKRQEMQSARQQQDNNFALVLIGVVIVFVVCQSPALLTQIF